MIFYPASADRREATIRDIIPGERFTSFEEANDFLILYGHDSDDKVFAKIKGKWVIVWYRNTNGELMVSDIDDNNVHHAIPLTEYINSKGE